MLVKKSRGMERPFVGNRVVIGRRWFDFSHVRVIYASLIGIDDR